MSTTLAMAVEDRGRTPSRCEECPFGQCDFRVPLVRFYLAVWRQAQINREPFAEVLRHRSRNSRTIDPAIRGKGFDWQRARVIGWTLDEVFRAHGQAFMHPANAEAVSLLLCPERALEDA